jgi:hypothetical protein
VRAWPVSETQRDWQAAAPIWRGPVSTLKSMPFDFGAWTDGIGEARDGSHEAERMSRPI